MRLRREARIQRVFEDPCHKWTLVERYCSYREYVLVFRRGNETLEVNVAEHVWKSFDRPKKGS